MDWEGSWDLAEVTDDRKELEVVYRISFSVLFGLRLLYGPGWNGLQ